MQPQSSHTLTFTPKAPVFTVPEELNPIIYSNQKFIYAALYHAASDTLSELAADSKYLGLISAIFVSSIHGEVP